MGMLDAACPGEVFTSPVPDQMLAATKAVDGGAGVLHIVKNYTGDIMNFEIAAELARAEGIEVEPRRDRRRRRGQGLACTRPAGAASVARCWRRRSSARPPRRAPTWPTVTAAVPEGASQRPLDGHGADSLHRPRRRQADVRARRRRDGDRHRHPRRAGPERMKLGHGRRDHRDARRRRSSTTCRSRRAISVLAFVNGMGGTPLIELYVVFNKLAADLRRPRHHDRAQPRRQLHHLARDGRAARSRCSSSTTSSSGCGTPRSTRRPCAGASERRVTGTRSEATVSSTDRITSDDVVAWIRLRRGRLREQKEHLTALDSAIGDADHGINMDRGLPGGPGEARRRSPPDDVGALLKAVGMTLMSTVGGAERPAVRHVLPPARQRDGRQGRASTSRTSPQRWTTASTASRPRQGGAGDKTMLEALLPAQAAIHRAADEGESPPTALRAGRGGRGGHARHDPARRPQGPGQLSRGTQRGPPGPGCDLDPSPAQGRRRRLVPRLGGDTANRSGGIAWRSTSEPSTRARRAPAS